MRNFLFLFSVFIYAKPISQSDGSGTDSLAFDTGQMLSQQLVQQTAQFARLIDIIEKNSNDMKNSLTEVLLNKSLGGELKMLSDTVSQDDHYGDDSQIDGLRFKTSIQLVKPSFYNITINVVKTKFTAESNSSQLLIPDDKIMFFPDSATFSKSGKLVISPEGIL